MSDPLPLHDRTSTEDTGESQSPASRAGGKGLAFGLGAVLAVVAGLWSLALPNFDPVGTVFGYGRDAASDLVNWRNDLPVDGPQIDLAAARFALRDADHEAGRLAISRAGCGSCHVIPGVSQANGRVGPSLAGFRNQAYVAGILPNHPGNLISWLMNPPAHAPQTVMPNVGLPEVVARDMAAYLYTLDRDQ